MSDQPQQSTSWDECRRGEISSMVRRVKTRRRRRFALKLTAGAAVAVLLGAALFPFLPSRQPAGGNAYGGISCAEVRRHAKAYVNREGTLSPEMRRRIDAHVEHCPECLKLVQDMQKNRHATSDGTAVEGAVVIPASLWQREHSLVR